MSQGVLSDYSWLLCLCTVAVYGHQGAVSVTARWAVTDIVTQFSYTHLQPDVRVFTTNPARRDLDSHT